jgi:3',5'-cyclic AMP phosphodiesterase CpdA
MRFAVLGDLHYSDYEDATHALARDRLFKAFFTRVAAEDPDLVFAVGDTTNLGTMSELAGLSQLARECNLPLITITGNHDINSHEKHEISQFFLGGWSSHSKTELYASFETGPVQFVLMDTARVKLSDIDWSGHVSQDQLVWLKNEIEHFNRSSDLEYLMVFGHHPIFGTTRRSEEEMLYIANSSEVQASFSVLEQKRGFYFCGHNHCHSIYRPRPEKDPWHYIQTANPLDCRSFRIVTIEPNRVEVTLIYFDLSDPGLQADFEITRSNIASGFHPQVFDYVDGEETDQKFNFSY